MTVEIADSDAAAVGSTVRALFADLAHGGEMVDVEGAGATGAIFSGEAGNREQGTQVRVQLRLTRADRTVHEMRYRAFGCPYTLAACEWLARTLGGRALGALSPQGLAEAVGPAAQWGQALAIPAARLGRLLVIEDALCAALQAAAAVSPAAAGESPHLCQTPP